VIVTNSSGVTATNITAGTTPEFVASSSCGFSLASGASCAIRVQFQPAAEGARGGALTIGTNGGPKIVPLYGTGSAKGENTLEAVEYYYADFDSYFVTAQPDEVVKLDSGLFVGWTRTGFNFKVSPIGTAGALTVCRFYSVAFGPKSAHFYTPAAEECAKLKSNPDWTFEGEVFGVAGAAADGTCAAGKVPVYRLYNNGAGGAPNHRYTSDATTRDTMIAAGWVLEGNGPGLAFMCGS
jgi:hypothetical protein